MTTERIADVKGHKNPRGPKVLDSVEPTGLLDV